MSDIQKLPAVTETARVETGPVQFGDDWPGIFIRGDTAGWFAFMLKQLLTDGVLSEESDMLGVRMVLGNLQQTLSGCVVGPAAEMMQFDVEALKAAGRTPGEIDLLKRLGERVDACLVAGRRDHIRWARAEARAKRLEELLRNLLKTHLPSAGDDPHIDAYNAADDFIKNNPPEQS